MKNQLKENEIASQFSLLLTLNQRKNFINNLPEKINLGKILKNLKSGSDKAEFVKLLLKKEPFFYKFIRKYKKERAQVMKKLAVYKNDYKKVRNVLNGLRKENKVLLKDEAIKISSKRKKYKNFYESVFKAEAFADLIKENNYNGELLNKLLIKNNKLISDDKLFFENLKDIFEFDGYLNNLNDDFNRFVIDNVDNNKSAKEIILSAEERILSGDILNIYNEIEKAEKLLSRNISQILLNIYNSIDVMDSKKSFVMFIEETEEGVVAESDLNFLRTRSNEYRNIDLPNKWNEMKHKLKFTENIHHFIAWYYGLQQGIYKHVVANVKGYIVTEIIKIILYGINEKFADHKINTVNLLNLIDAKSKNIEDIKSAYKSLFNKELVKKLKDQELFMQLENFFVYFVYLNYDLKEEKDLLDELFNKLKQFKTVGDKINYLEKSRNEFSAKSKDEQFKDHIIAIYNNIGELYKIFNNKENIKAEKEKPDIDEEAGSEVITFLNKLYEDFQKGKSKDIAARITSLPHDKDLEVITVLKFDPRFEEFYPEVEDTLYLKDWGRTLGVIVYKAKDVEKRFGALTSEDYLEDLEERMKFKFGENAFIVRKIRNMRINLGLLHKEGTKKLHYLNEKLTRAKTSANKIIELQRISRDPRFKGIFGTIKNMERILVRDRFEDIYEKVQNLPVDTQIVLFQGIKDDLKSLLKYEPEIVNKVMNYIDGVKSGSLSAKKEIGKVDDRLVENMDRFEKKEIPLSDLTDLMEIELPEKHDYQKENTEKSAEIIKSDVNNGIKGIEELDSLMEEINNDLSLFKIDQSGESVSLIDNAKELLNEIDRNIDSAEKLDELKNAKSMKDIVLDIFENDNEELIDKIDKLDTVFNCKNYDFEEKAKGFIISSKKVKDPEGKTKLNEIVEVIRRIEKEVEPLDNLESRVNKLVQWIEKDYRDKDHITEFLKKQIRELGLKIGREGGLLRQLMDGMEQSADKTKYLKEMMLKFEYQHLIPVIKALLENMDEEKKIKEEDINGELIDKILNGFAEDEKKLTWLKARKYWDKYEKHQDYIDGRIEKCVKKGVKEEIYRDIIDLAERVLQIKSPGERQSLIKEQMDKDKDADNVLTGQRKLLFYLMSSDSGLPKDRVKSLAQRLTLTSQEKQKYLQLLKKSGSNEKGLIKDKLNITDEDIAYYSLLILYPDKSADVRIKYLERFKNSDDEKINQYKAAFDVTDKIIDSVIKDLMKKSSKKEENIPESAGNMNADEETAEKEKNVFIKETVKTEDHKTDEDEDFKKLEAIMKGEKIDDAAGEASLPGIEEENIPETEITEETAGLNEEETYHDKGIQKGEIDVLKKQSGEKKNKLEYTDEDDKGFTEEELKEMTESGENPVIGKKSTREIISEQKLRDDIKKRDEQFKAVKLNKIQNRILSLGEKSKAVIVQNIQKKARQIYEDKHKRIEDKITDIISYLTACYTEAITQIIDEEILPVFKEEGVNLNSYNLLSSINNSVFKPVLQNRDVEDNIKFLEKTLSKKNIDNIKLIAEKLKTLWKSVEKQVQKEHDDFENAVYDINQGRGVSSLIIYLDNLEADNVIKEIDNNLLTKIQSDNVKEALRIIRNNLVSVFNSGLLKDKKEMIFEKLNLNRKYQDIFDSLVEKIKLLSFEEAAEEKKEGKKEVKKAEQKEEQKEEVEEEMLTDNVTSFREKLKKAEEKETEKASEKQEEDFSFIETPEVVEDEMSKLNRFIKPHLFLNELSKKHKLLELADVNNRKKIIEKLYKKGRIFTYDGSTYIGEGQINNLVNKESVPKPDRSKFVDRLDNFLNRFSSKEEIFHFLGVRNEMEFRKLNFLLDKYNVNRTPSKFAKDIEEKSKPAEKEKKQEPSDQIIEEGKEVKKTDRNIERDNRKTAKYIEKFKQKVKEKEKKKVEKKEKVQNFMLNRKDFVNKNQRELLNMAKNEINSRLKNLIKSVNSRLDLDAVYKNYFGDNELNKRNMLNLCGNIKQISDIIRKDPALFNKLSFDKEKLKKIFNDKYRKYK